MTNQDKKPNKGFWRENIEALAFAIIMALVIKQFAFEAYKVPTQSMEPTIIGRDVGGSRLIANKFTYMVREPKRWEVMIFQYPHNRMLNYVKRGVGVGPEWLFIRGGDIYTADYDLSRDEALKRATIVRKPSSLQQRIFDMSQCIAPGKRDMENFRNYWIHEKGARGEGVHPDFKEEVVTLTAGDEPVRVRFTRPAGELTVVGGRENVICNRRFDDWSARAPQVGEFSKLLGRAFPVAQENLSEPVPVGDVRLQFEVKPEGDGGRVLFELHDCGHPTPIVVEIPVGTEGSGHLLMGDTKESFDAHVPADEWTEVSLSNYDDRVEVRVDDDMVFTFEYTHPMVPVSHPVLSNARLAPPPEEELSGGDADYKPFRNAVLWGFSGGTAQFRSIDLARDIYYTESGATDFHIPRDNFLMLGDNSPDSLDGRSWRVAEMRYRNDEGEEVVLIGDAEAVTEAPTRPMVNPFDGNTRFLDHYGNLHHIDPSRIVMVPQKVGNGVEEMLPATIRLGNFVPRSFIQGRAYLTFFPILQIGPIH